MTLALAKRLLVVLALSVIVIVGILMFTGVSTRVDGAGKVDCGPVVASNEFKYRQEEQKTQSDIASARLKAAVIRQAGGEPDFSIPTAAPMKADSCEEALGSRKSWMWGLTAVAVLMLIAAQTIALSTRNAAEDGEDSAPDGMFEAVCSRCNARQNVDLDAAEYTCWQCKQVTEFVD